MNTVLSRIPTRIFSDRSISSSELQVILTLGKFSDASGHCFPYRKTIAEITGLSVTRISTITTQLVHKGYLIKQGKGGRLGCKYRIIGDTDSASSPSNGTGSDRVNRCRSASENPRGSGRVNTELPLEPPSEQPQQQERAFKASEVVVDIQRSERKTHSGGRNEHLSDQPDQSLEFPKEIDSVSSSKLLMSIPDELRQPVLDELAANLKDGRVRSPFRYLLSLIQRAKKGTFIPDAGISIARLRTRRQQNERAVKRVEMSDPLERYCDRHTPYLRPAKAFIKSEMANIKALLDH
jgi:hypothetical protein